MQLVTIVLISVHMNLEARILTEHMQPNGAEELCSILNAFFTILVRTVHKFNGDIIKVHSCLVPLGVFMISAIALQTLLK